MNKHSTFFLLFLTTCYNIIAQDIELFTQFNGHYDYLAIGNTLNENENNLFEFCTILESSSATLEIPENSNIVSAYLFWAGSGTGDNEISLNGHFFETEETFNVVYNDANFGPLSYFANYKDISNFIIEQGETDYIFSDLDISEALNNYPGYCENRTNFAGWCIYVIFENEDLPINQINLFQGLEIIDRNNTEKSIQLENVNVLDNEGAKIGFLAWEGDEALNYGESLILNDNILSNLPLNPEDNAFNGTNSFNYSNNLFNCDIDYYNIENFINIGDNNVDIVITTGAFDGSGIFRADLIILNNIITVLNSQLPDATTEIISADILCGNTQADLNFRVFNTNATDILPAQTPISIYADGMILTTLATTVDLMIDEYEEFSITIDLPPDVANNFSLTVIVDDIGNGTGLVNELNESNNSSEVQLNLSPIQVYELEDLLNCDIGFNSALYDLYDPIVDIQNYEDAYFYHSYEELIYDSSSIVNPSNYQNLDDPDKIFVKIPSSPCYNVYVFDLITENCPPIIPEVFTPNGDGYNDWFNIQGLYDIFENHQLLIYNRYGTLIFEGDNDHKWNGQANRGINNLNKNLPTGTYFYILILNDSNYENMVGWTYLTR